MMSIIEDRVFLHGYVRVVIIPQPSFLRELGMSMHRFNKIIRNDVEMSMSEALVFVRVLNCTLEELFYDEKKQSNRVSTSNPVLS
ncbi:MAG: hypothetical protein LBF89_03770 [Bacteroidales bacterium]|nr:hypothetical protein [Bacteroidales bacterium]